MPQFFSKSLLGLAGISCLALLSQPATALVPSNVAVITNSGSTNFIGYRIYVSPSGEATYVDGSGQGTGRISSSLRNRFFRDIQSATPLSQLPVQHCLKSVSFGTSTTIRLGAEASPDVSCPGNGKAKALEQDAMAIAKALRVKNIPRSQGHDLPPQNF